MEWMPVPPQYPREGLRSASIHRVQCEPVIRSSPRASSPGPAGAHPRSSCPPEGASSRRRHPGSVRSHRPCRRLVHDDEPRLHRAAIRKLGTQGSLETGCLGCFNPRPRGPGVLPWEKTFPCAVTPFRRPVIPYPPCTPPTEINQGGLGVTEKSSTLPISPRN